MNDSKDHKAAAEPPLDCDVMPCPFCGETSIPEGPQHVGAAQDRTVSRALGFGPAIPGFLKRPGIGRQG